MSYGTDQNDMFRLAAPPQQKTSLFDDFVGGHEQRGWHGQADRLRGFEIDGHFVLGWRLYRYVGGRLQEALHRLPMPNTGEEVAPQRRVHRGRLWEA
jgi:hypothetical protein